MCIFVKMNSINGIRAVKLLVTGFFLFITFSTVTSIFTLNFAHSGLKFSVDSWTEEQVLMILNSTWMSMLATLCLGILSVWINFVFVRIIFNNEIREAALALLKDRKRKFSPIDYYTEMIERGSKPWFARLRARLKKTNKNDNDQG